MKSQGIIYHGLDQNLVLAQAYDLLVKHMSSGNLDYNTETISRYVKGGMYPNFFLLKKSEDENEISVDKAREMISFLSQKATFRGPRGVLIENFEDMSLNASNSILKVLEEPPLDSLIVLTTRRLFAILPTVRSRCLKVRVNCGTVDPSEYTNVWDFVSKLSELDGNQLKDFMEFIEGNESVIDFSRRNTDHIESFLKVAKSYSSFKVAKNLDLDYSRKLLELEEFERLMENTYPDKLSGLIAICEILKKP